MAGLRPVAWTLMTDAGPWERKGREAPAAQIGGSREMGSTGTVCLLQIQAGSSREIFSNNLILCRARFGD